MTSRWHDWPVPPAPRPAPEAGRIIRAVLNHSLPHLNPPVADCAERVDQMRRGRYTFLNLTLELNSIDWNRRYASHLWNYHLHYFNQTLWGAHVIAAGGDESAFRYCRNSIESWIADARIGLSDGWDPYPLSLRAVNWIYASALIEDGYPDREFLDRWHSSLYRQLDFLSRHLEFHLLANHLLKNAKALVIGGLYFNQPRWLARGEALLWREFEEQVLADGGHYERSPSYHAQALADLLEGYALLRAFDRLPRRTEIESKLRAMAAFLEALSYPDGTLALFNDSVNSEESRPEPILESAGRICAYRRSGRPTEFRQTGYYLWASPDESEKMIVDAGPPSVPYNAAHAHCDLLSYELRLDGRPFIVDSGLHGYGGDPFREYCRSTRAHNTVMIEECEQSEVWGTFRMARRSRSIRAEAGGNDREWSFQGQYRPYAHRRLLHHRRIRRGADGAWHFEDRLIGDRARRAASFIHLHPEVQAETCGRRGLTIECRVGAIRAIIKPFAARSVKIVRGAESPIQGWYFPDFGRAEPSATICLEHLAANGDPFGYEIRWWRS